MISNKPATNQQRKIFDESTRKRVQLQRRHVNIPVHIAVHRAAPIEEDGGLLTIQEAAKELGLAPSTSHRWLGGGFIGGEQATLGAAEDPAHSRDPFALRRRRASRMVRDSRGDLPLWRRPQTIMQPVKRGELCAVDVRTGRRKGLRVETRTPQNQLCQR